MGACISCVAVAGGSSATASGAAGSAARAHRRRRQFVETQRSVSRYLIASEQPGGVPFDFAWHLAGAVEQLPRAHRDALFSAALYRLLCVGSAASIRMAQEIVAEVLDRGVFAKVTDINTYRGAEAFAVPIPPAFRANSAPDAKRAEASILNAQHGAAGAGAVVTVSLAAGAPVHTVVLESPVRSPTAHAFGPSASAASAEAASASADPASPNARANAALLSVRAASPSGITMSLKSSSAADDVSSIRSTSGRANSAVSTSAAGAAGAAGAAAAAPNPTAVRVDDGVFDERVPADMKAPISPLCALSSVPGGASDSAIRYLLRVLLRHCCYGGRLPDALPACAHLNAVGHHRAGRPQTPLQCAFDAAGSIRSPNQVMAEELLALPRECGLNVEVVLFSSINAAAPPRGYTSPNNDQWLASDVEEYRSFRSWRIAQAGGTGADHVTESVDQPLGVNDVDADDDDAGANIPADRPALMASVARVDPSHLPPELPVHAFDVIIARASYEALNARDAGGNTPLTLAVRRQHFAVVRSLLARVPEAVNLFARDAAGRVASDYCPRVTLSAVWRAAEWRQRKYMCLAEHAVRTTFWSLPDGRGLQFAPASALIIAYLHDGLQPLPVPVAVLDVGARARRRITRAAFETLLSVPHFIRDLERLGSSSDAEMVSASSRRLSSTPVQRLGLISPSRMFAAMLARTASALADDEWATLQCATFNELMRRGTLVDLRRAMELVEDVTRAGADYRPLRGLAHADSSSRGPMTGHALMLWARIPMPPAVTISVSAAYNTPSSTSAASAAAAAAGGVERIARDVEYHQVLAALLEVLMHACDDNSARNRLLNGFHRNEQGTVLHTILERDNALQVVAESRDAPLQAQLLLDLPREYGLDIDAQALTPPPGHPALGASTSASAPSAPSEPASTTAYLGSSLASSAPASHISPVTPAAHSGIDPAMAPPTPVPAPAPAPVAMLPVRHTAISTAVGLGQTRIAVQLIARSTNLNARSTRRYRNGGESLLHQALRLKRTAITIALLQRVPHVIDPEDDVFRGDPNLGAVSARDRLAHELGLAMRDIEALDVLSAQKVVRLKHAFEKACQRQDTYTRAIIGVTAHTLPDAQPSVLRVICEYLSKRPVV